MNYSCVNKENYLVFLFRKGDKKGAQIMKFGKYAEFLYCIQFCDNVFTLCFSSGLISNCCKDKPDCNKTNA